MQHPIHDARLRPPTPALRLLSWLAGIGLLLSALAAQAQVATIGSTAVPPVAPATADYYFGPIYRSSSASTFDYSRYAYLYTAAELAAAGIGPGVTITDLGWLKSDVQEVTGSNNSFEVRLANSALTTLATGTTWGTLKTGTTVTYSSSTQNVTGAAGTYFSVTNTASFVYTGGNLLVLTDWTKGGASNGGVNFVVNPAVGLAIGTASGTALTDATTLSTSLYGDKRPTLRITAVPTTPCTAPPTAGTAVSSVASGCGTVNASLSLTGSSFGSGLTYQWQQSTTGPTGTFTDIAGATNFSYAATLTATTTFRAVLTCSGQSATSTPVTVSVLAQPAYATLPYTEDFENWVSRCGNTEVPGANWQNALLVGNSSWRRDDQGATAGWTGLTSGGYSPAFTTGAHSARFHSYLAPSSTPGSLDLFANAVGTGTLTLNFDYINTSGTDKLEVLLSTDGGVTFGMPLFTQAVSATWTPFVVSLPGATATTVVRLRATGDSGSTDIGLDNLRLALVTCPAVTGVSATSTGTTASVAFTASPGAAGYTVTYTTASGTAQTATGTTSPIALTGLLPGTTYTVSVVANCGGTNGSSTGTTTSFSTQLSGGTYTINNLLPTGGSNFASFTAAAAVLNGGGIGGGATFDVLNGPYNEQFVLNQVAGTSATSRLVINGNGRTIQFGSGDTNQRGVIQLNGTDYVTVDSLVVDATVGGTSTSTFGFGIQLTTNADNNIIRRCRVTTSSSSTSTNFAGIVSSATTSSATGSGTGANQNLLIEGNTVTGGYYGITVSGNSTASPSPGTSIRNNQVRDFYFYGVYGIYQEGLQIVGNDVSRPTRTAVSTYYGIYLSSGVREALVARNRLHRAFTAAATSTSGAYGIYVGTSTAASATQPNDIVNNLIYDLDGNGSVYGLYNPGSVSVRYYYNTVNIDDQANTGTGLTYGFYNTTGTGVEFKNNIVRITRSGTGVKYAIYLTSATGGTDSNNNDLTGSGAGFVTGRYLTTDYATLANWQTANGGIYDQNSVAADPQYVSLATGNLQPTNAVLNNAGAPVAGVSTDFTGAPRNATTPDIGAYEFTPVSVDVSSVALLSPGALGGCYGAAVPLTVQIRNSGANPLNLATNAATVTVVVTPPTGAAQTFTTTVSTGTVAPNATLNVTLPGTLNMSALGAYSFAVTATAVGDLNTSNNVLTPAPTRTVAAPVAGVLSPGSTAVCSGTPPTLTLAGSANGNIQYQSSASATGPFTDVAGATGAAYSPPVLAADTYFRVKVSCNGTDVFSNVAAITVTNPQLLTTPAASTCAGGTAQLLATASAGATVKYYATATGGTPLTSSTTGGGPFTTPTLTTTTTYYAAAVVGSSETVGPLTNAAIGPNGGATSLTYGEIFTVLSPTTLTGVYVYPGSAGVANIELQTSAGTRIGMPYQATFTAADVNVKTFVPLNFQLPAGTDLRLMYVSTGSTTTLYRNTDGAMYPYTSASGNVSITGNTFSGFPTYYYYFYDWQIGSECAGTRTPIVVTVTPGLVATLPQAAATICGPTPYALNGAFAGTATGLTYTSTGTGTFAPNATTPNATYTPSAADITAGTVTITATPTGPAAPCTSTGTVVLTIQTPPNASFSYPTPAAMTYCIGTGTVAPVLAAGASAGVFSTTGAGLRIDPVSGVINLATSTQPGTFTITNTVPGSGVCQGFTSTAQITLNFGAPAPGTPVAVTQANGAVVLSVATPVTGVLYQFFQNGVAVGPASSANTLTLLSSAQNGSYTVVASTTAGCVSPASAATVVTVLGARSSAGGLALDVAPNPTSDGRVSVRLSGATAAAPLTVLNALGQVVATGTAGGRAAELNLTGLAAGVYVLRVTTPQGVLTQRLVRE